MKIKIVEAGWAGFTGHLGPTEFIDGESVHDVSPAEMLNLSGIVALEDVSTGRDPSVAQALIESLLIPAPVHRLKTQAEIDAEAKNAPAPVGVAKIYTEDELKAVADAEGIKGLRVIGEPLRAQGKSIAELIGKILAAQTEIENKRKADEAAAAAAAAAAEAPKA
jgi:hypothetical protein